jgi:hypothetical protein
MKVEKQSNGRTKVKHKKLSWLKQKAHEPPDVQKETEKQGGDEVAAGSL